MDNWEEMIAHREDVLLEDIDIFKDYYVISERSNGLNRIKVVKWDGADSYYLPFDNETYTAFVSVNPEFDSKVLRYVYNSLITPSSIIDFNMDTREQIILKETEVLGTGLIKIIMNLKGYGLLQPTVLQYQCRWYTKKELR